MIRRVLAQCTVTDIQSAERWYTVLFGREPDARPMDGLIEWHVGDTAGLQLWSEPEWAGRSSVVLGADDLDATAAQASQAGMANNGPQPGGDGRIVALIDPDGNRVILAGG